MTRRCSTRPLTGCTLLGVACAVALALQPCAARAQEAAAADLRIRLDAGAGMHESVLSGVNGTRRVSATWFPAAGFQVTLVRALGSRLRIGGALHYVSSLHYELSRAIEPDTRESSSARAQEFSALASLAVALDASAEPISLPISVGYGGSAFSTATPLTAAQSYLVSGPRAAIGLELPLRAAHLQFAAYAEAGTQLTATRALRDAGVHTLGWSLAYRVELELRLGAAVRLGLRYREARLALPADFGSFHEMHRFVLASLTLRNDL